MPAAATAPSARLTAGIRPEDVIIGSGPWRGHVSVIEPTGHETLVFVDVEGHRMVARVASDHPVRALTTVPVGGARRPRAPVRYAHGYPRKLRRQQRRRLRNCGITIPD